MSLQAKTILNLIAGAVAGLLAWALTDLTGWFPFLHVQRVLYPNDPQLLLYGAVFGLLLGLLLGVVEALSLDSLRQMWIALAAGGVIGFFGGAFGAFCGQSVYAMLAPKGIDVDGGSPVIFFQRLFARAVGYALVGAIVGAAQGISRRSTIITRQGLFGGFVGGAIGGIVFQVIAGVMMQVPHVDVLSRLAALAATGALVGFFVGLVQNLFKQAWIRVVLGRNEGKEYLLAKPITTIGRSELSDIGLYGDPQIAPTHAVIEAMPDQKRHRLRHVADAPGQGRSGPYPPTFVNGQPVTAEQWLADGDTLQIGKRTLLFQEKATRGKAPLPVSAPAVPASVETGSRPAAVPAAAFLATGTAPRYIGQELTEAPAMPPPARGMGMDSPVEATVVMSQSSGLGTRLVCTQGPYAGQSFTLSHEPTVLGRAADCDIALTADTLVSRRQAEITYEEGRHRLRDLGSSNGTHVNGRRLAEPHPLATGELLQLGDTVFRYE